MAATSNISAVFNARTGPFDKGTKKVVQDLNRITKGAKSTGSALKTLRNIEVFRLFTSAIGTAVRSLTRLKRELDTVINSIDKSAKTARTLGMSFEGYEGLALVFRESGVEATLAEAMIAKLLRRVGEARQGNKLALDTFKKLGFSMEELNTISTEDVFARTIQGLKDLGDQYDRQLYGQRLFEETGAKLGSVIEAGAEGFREAAKAVKDFGLVLRTGQFKAVETLKNNIERTKLSVEGLKRQIVANLAPAIAGVAKLWNDWVRSIGVENLGKSLAKYMLEAVISASKWFDSIQFGIKDVEKMLDKALKNVQTINAIVQTPFAGADEIGSSLVQGVAELDYAESKILNFFGIISDEQLKQSKTALEVARQVTQNSRAYVDSLWGWSDKAEQAAFEYSARTKALQQGLIDMEANANSPFKDPKKTGETLGTAISKAISTQLASIDARSQEGVNFVLAQTTQRRQTIEQQQLQVLRKIEQHTKAEGTAPGRTALLYAIP